MPLNSMPKANVERMLSIFTKESQMPCYVPIQMSGDIKKYSKIIID